MRLHHWMTWVALVGCGGSGHDSGQAGSSGHDSAQSDAGSRDKPGGGAGQGAAGRGSQTGAGRGAAGSGSNALTIPRVYPLVRASTPSGLVANPDYRLPGDPSLDIFDDDAGAPPMPGSISLARVIQERLYSAGPTELLRIISGLDGRTAQLDTDTSKHSCLTGAPMERSLTLAGGQTFRLQLQCMDERNGGWMAFGFAPPEASDADAGPVPAASDRDFYLVAGQEGGMGGAYHIFSTGAVEAWLTVADSRAPNNSQVIMHLLTNRADSSTELTLGGSGVGFCSAHLKTGNNNLFIQGKTNAPPPPGAPNGHYCDVQRAGCFSTTELNTDLGAGAAACAGIAAASFAIHESLDASSAGNVMPATIYAFFDAKPQGIPAY